MTRAIRLMRQAVCAKNRRQLRLVRGKFQRLIINAHLSDALFDSAMREFDRVSPRGLRW